jgi:hypothetical protein
MTSTCQREIDAFDDVDAVAEGMASVSTTMTSTKPRPPVEKQWVLSETLAL